jgi:hypothetical protein
MEQVKMEEFIKSNILDTVSKKYKYDPESIEYLMNIKGQLVNVLKTVDETIEYMINVKKIKDKRNGVVYPFDEGDDYWTIEEMMDYGEYKLLVNNNENPERYKVVWSCWDYESEQMHDENPNQEYFMSEKSAIQKLVKLQSR